MRVGQYDGQKVIEMGYGSTDYGYAYANVLKVATASMMPNSQCQQTYGNEVTAQDSCTYSTSRNDTCQVNKQNNSVKQTSHFCHCILVFLEINEHICKN